MDPFGNPRGDVLDLESMPLGRLLQTMPDLHGNFAHVTRLHMRGTGFTDAQVSFLDHFPRLCALDMNDNDLICQGN